LPTIVVSTDTNDGEKHTQLHERVPAALMIDPHATGQLIERIALAMVDASAL
jgi:hypothetical protein